MSKQPEDRYIHRFEYKRTTGWYVQVEKTVNKRRYRFKSKLFSDSRFQGPLNSLLAARIYRDLAVTELSSQLRGRGLIE